jgi:hypothetical protein
MKNERCKLVDDIEEHVPCRRKQEELEEIIDDEYDIEQYYSFDD